jgi:hypothetical protein
MANVIGYMLSEQKSDPILFAAAGRFTSGIFAFLIFFTVAQVLDRLARIEFYAQRSNGAAILQSLRNIEKYLASLRTENKDLT